VATSIASRKARADAQAYDATARRRLKAISLDLARLPSV
jgi:hypothetical protein